MLFGQVRLALSKYFSREKWLSPPRKNWPVRPWWRPVLYRVICILPTATRDV